MVTHTDTHTDTELPKHTHLIVILLIPPVRNTSITP